MEIAVISVWVVEAASHREVDMVAVRHRQMSGGVVMPLLAFDGGADGWAPPIYLEPMLVDMLSMRGMKMAVVQVVRVIAVSHRPVAARGSVIVLVTLMLATARLHQLVSSSLDARTTSNGIIPP